MERVTTLVRKKSSRGEVNLHKLKLDLPNNRKNAFSRTVKFLAKSLEDNINSELNEIMIFNNFTVKCEKCDEALSESINKGISNFVNELGTLWRLTIYDNFDNEFEVYTLAGGKINDKAKKYRFFRNGIGIGSDKSIKILDIKAIWGTLTFLDLVHEECNENDIYFNTGFEEISIFGVLHMKSTLETVTSLKSLNGAFELYGKNFELAFDALLMMKLIDSNNELTRQYNKESQKECARAFETKKNIPQKVLDVMKSSKFLNKFSYLELDQDVDLKKFSQIEREWNKVYKCLNLENINWIVPQLRFRKLGKHRALGIYFPSLKCICVDINSPSSFIHELAHHLDYTSSDKQLSLDFKFLKVIVAYKRAYNQWLSTTKSEEQAKYYRRKQDYYFTPTEIFARTFEMYLVEKGVKTSYLKVESDLTMENGGYPQDFRLYSALNEYFNEFITLDLDALEDNTVSYAEPVNTYNCKIEDIIFSEAVQISLF